LSVDGFAQIVHLGGDLADRSGGKREEQEFHFDHFKHNMGFISGFSDLFVLF
jgi:hypothetical protein